MPYEAGKYYPDFVVVDRDVIYWVLEAKSDQAATDSESVQQKAEAAERWIERVNEARQFGSWRYKIVTEAQIAAAVDWKSLITS